jgi:hypothetical protein
MSKGPRRPKEPKEDDFEQQESRIAKVMATISQLKDEKVMLQEQFDRLVQRTSHLQNEINSRHKEQSTMMKEDGPQPEEKEEVAIEHKEKQQQEDMIKEELLKMLQERLTQHRGVKGVEMMVADVAATSMQIHTIRVRYMINAPSSKNDSGYEVYEATFRIGKNTSFERLLEELRKLWNIPNLDLKHLRTAAMQSFDCPPSQVIEKMLIDSGIPPDIWIHGVGQGLGLDPQKVQITINNLTESAKQAKNTKKIKTQKMVTGDNEQLQNAMMPYKGLKTMLPPRTTSTKVAIGPQHKDTQCCTITFLLLLLILTSYIYAGRAVLKDAFNIHHGVLMALNKDFAPRKNFEGIRTLNDYMEFLYYVLPTALFRNEGEERAKLPDQYKFVGGLMIRSLNVLGKECSHVDDLPMPRNCTYESYTPSTRDTRDITTVNNDLKWVYKDDSWRVYRSSSENNISSSFQGEFSSYDGSGYSIVFPDMQITADAFQQQIRYMLYNGFTTVNTRAIFITATLYCPSLAVWATIDLVVELSPAGAVYPNTIITKVFHPNIFLTESDKNMQVADIFRILFSFYIFYMFVFEVVVGQDNKPNIQHIFSFQGLMDLFMIASIFAAFAISYSLDADTEGILRKNQFRGMGEYSDAYFAMLQFNIIALVLIILRIVIFMRIIPAINIILLTMQTAVPGYMTFVAVFGPLLVGISLLTMSIWGPYMYQYHTIQSSIVSNLLFYLGSGDTDTMMDLSSSWGLIFFTIFFFLFLYFLICEAISTYVEAYINVRLSLGYEGSMREEEEDEESEKAPPTATLKSFLRWLVEFLPAKWKVALFERENRFNFDKILS